MTLLGGTTEETTTQSARSPGAGSVLIAWDDGHLHVDVPASEQLRLGRGADVDVVIPHSSVSRRHALLRIVGAELEVRDLGSHNGTIVHGRRLAIGEPARVAPEEAIRLGEVSLVFRREATKPSVRTLRSADATQQTADLVAQGRLTVLICGESGAGKEVLAARIHAKSPRAAERFVRINCAALPESLLEGELLGYERGAFTGAVGAKPGLLEAADRGSVLLDEIGDLPLGTQAKLLRVLEDREVSRLGSVRPRRVDVRFISATNRDLQAMIAAGSFRADLYYRLSGVTLTVPPLRDRPTEIEPLVRELVRATCSELGRPAVGVSETAWVVLLRHTWPGNVRELKNAIECAVLVCGAGPIEPVHLNLRMQAPAMLAPASLSEELETLERQRIEAALARCNGNQTRAAKLLGIPRHVLVARITAWGLPRPRKA